MAACEQFQAQYLDYLYDLLDDQEMSALRAHLAVCSACQAALESARDQQKLLSAAARLGCSGTRFEAPAMHPAPSPVPAASAPAPGRGRWAVLAMAASLLLALGTLATAGLLLAPRHHWQAEYARLADEAGLVDHKHQKALEIAGQHVAELQNEAAAELRENAKELEAINGQIGLNLVVSGPKDFQPDAPNTFEIQTQDASGRPVEAELEVRVLLRNKQVAKDMAFGAGSEASKAAESASRKADGGQSAPASIMLNQAIPATPPKSEPQASAALRAANTNNQLGAAGAAPNGPTPTAAAPPLTGVAPPLPTNQAGNAPAPPGSSSHATADLADMKKQPSLNTASIPAGPALNGEHVLDQKRIASPGNYQLTLAPMPQMLRDSEVVLEVLAHRQGGTQQLRERLEPARPLYQTYLTLDRSSYQPGEVVRFSSLTLDRFSLKPAAENLTVVYKLKEPSGKEATLSTGGQLLSKGQLGGRGLPAGQDSKLVEGIAAGELRLDPQAPAGEYTLTATEASQRFPPQEHTFRVLQPTSTAREAGKDLSSTKEKLADALARKRPTSIRVAFFPEGGDLVAGVPNRVYFEARTPENEPVDLQGRIVDQDGRPVVADVHTLHDAQRPAVNQGRGVFEIIPHVGRTYELRLDAPSGVQAETRWPARPGQQSTASGPDLTDNGVILSIPDGVTAATDPFQVRLRSPQSDRTLLVAAYCRGRLLAHRLVAVQKDELAEVELKPDQPVGGVYRVTVFEQRPRAGNRPQLVPLAERLVYRAAAERLHLDVVADKANYAAGARATINVQAATEKHEPAPAMVMAAVVDRRLLTPADEKTKSSLPTYFYLTSDVRRPEDLEYADFLLSPDCKPALDLVLGTRGWRRFAEQDADKFDKERRDGDRDGAETGRLVVMAAPASRERTDLLRKAKVEQQAPAAGRPANFGIQLADAKQAEQAIKEDTQYRDEASKLHEEAQAAGRKAAAADEAWETFRTRALPALAVFLVALAVVAFGAGILRGAARALPLVVTAVCALLLLGVAGVVFFRGSHPAAGNAEQAALTKDLKPGAAEESARAKERSAPASGPAGAADAPAEKVQQQTQALTPSGFKQEPGRPPAPLAATAPAAGEAPHGIGAGYDRAGGGGAGGKQPGASGTPVDDAFRRELRQADKASAPTDGARTPADQAKTSSAPRHEEADGKRDVKGASESKTEALQLERAVQKTPPDQAPLAPEAMTKSLAPSYAVPAPDAANKNGVKPPAPTSPPAAPQAEQLYFREYAYKRSATHGDGSGAGLPETLYWQPALVLPDGKASISFDLPDAVTTYQVIVYGHTLDGRLGTARATLEVHAK